MSLSERVQQHPVVAGTVCFVFLATALVGGWAAYKKRANDQARGRAAPMVKQVSLRVRQFEASLDTARAHLQKSGAALNADERIAVNRVIVVAEERLRLYCSVLSNANQALSRNDAEFFRSTFDPAEQSNVLHGLKRDEESLRQAIEFCRRRTR
jgi:hypothetical protein